MVLLDSVIKTQPRDRALDERDSRHPAPSNAERTLAAGYRIQSCRRAVGEGLASFWEASTARLEWKGRPESSAYEMVPTPKEIKRKVYKLKRKIREERQENFYQVYR
ncbi:uncharacterized protein LOC135218490 [Macrobrachium nipponense]|uniref:uncharacterized protein LOC135218490 n=1 Tax=Macrobrachium nipponense TaxID=159736 RepID=UPI0030C87CCE